MNSMKSPYEVRREQLARSQMKARKEAKEAGMKSTCFPISKGLELNLIRALVASNFNTDDYEGYKHNPFFKAVIDSKKQPEVIENAVFLALCQAKGFDTKIELFAFMESAERDSRVGMRPSKMERQRVSTSREYEDLKMTNQARTVSKHCGPALAMLSKLEFGGQSTNGKVLAFIIYELSAVIFKAKTMTELRAKISS